MWVQQQEKEMYGIERETEETSVMQYEEHDVSQEQEVQTTHWLHEQHKAQAEGRAPQPCRGQQITQLYNMLLT